MAKTSGDIPNLINGISQQSPETRLTTQGEICENLYPTTVDGLIKRPRTNFEARIGTILDGSFEQFILRGDDEKYLLIIEPDGTVLVRDLNGVPQIVTMDPSATAYLSGLTDPKTEIRALTIVDFTFIVNKTKVVQPGTTFSPTRPHEVLFNIVSGNYAKHYGISINGVEVAGYQTPLGDNAAQGPSIDTSYMSQQLFNMLSVGTPNDQPVAGQFGETFAGKGGFNNNNPWALGRFGNVVHLQNLTTDFSVATDDGFGQRAMIPLKAATQRFSDLPLFAPPDIVFEITGADGIFDSYWVKFVSGGDASSFGTWQECPAPGTRLGFDPSTMPHTLIRQADGTFHLTAAPWESRLCGDLDSVPDPSFVGATIQDVIFHKNRLGFLTEANIVMSEAGSFYNFYRKTLTALLDTDPIDVGATNTKITTLRHATPFQQQMLLSSDTTQFTLKGNNTLTPTTVAIDPLTELNSHPIVRPEPAGTSIYFTAELAEWASVYEYFIDQVSQTASFDTVTAHVPVFIPAGIDHFVVSPDLNIALLTTTGKPGSVFVYDYYWNGEQKLQSAWSEWILPNAIHVGAMEFDHGTLLICVERHDGTCYIESINLEQSLVDPGVNYLTYLDQHTLQNPSIAGGTQTVYTVPFPFATGIKCVTAAGGNLPAGVELTPSSVVTGSPGTSSVLTFDGDLGQQPLHFGFPYTSRYRFSPFFQRTPDGKETLTDGRLQVLYLSVVYSKAAYFRCEVTPQGRATRSYIFNGRVIGNPDNLTGVMVADNGRFSVPIMSRNDRVTIDLINDTWLPCAFTSAQWRGTWNPATKQL